MNRPAYWIWRVLATLALVGALRVLDGVVRDSATIGMGYAAGGQLANSDVAYVGSMAAMRFLQDFHVSGIFSLLGFIAVWWSPIRSFFMWLTYTDTTTK